MSEIDRVNELETPCSTEETIQPSSATPVRVPEPQITNFTIFPTLPAELRSKIWEAVLPSRIIRCTRAEDDNVFSAPTKSLPLFETCRESREIALLYGEYLLLSTSPTYVYFSPKIDYLLFDVGWKDLIPPTWTLPPVHPPKDFIASLEIMNPKLRMLRNVMVHPNWNNQRMTPTVLLARFPLLERILVASDEKSIGLRNEVMFATVHDIKMYYGATRKQQPEVTTPRIAVGCLGWTGEERRKIHHGSHDNRQLVAVFQDYAAMKEHQKLLQEEEKTFTRERFGQTIPSFVLKLRQAREASKTGLQSSSPKLPEPEDPSKLPTYDDATSTR